MMRLRTAILSAGLALATLLGGGSVPAAAAACPGGHWPASVEGRPASFEPGGPGGDYIWHDSSGWHLRVTHRGTDGVAFSGRIVSSAVLDGQPVKVEGRDTVALSADRTVLTYRFANYGGVDGFDFTTSCARRLTFEGIAAGRPLPVRRIWLGEDGVHPLENPFVVVRVG